MAVFLLQIILYDHYRWSICHSEPRVDRHEKTALPPEFPKSEERGSGPSQQMRKGSLIGSAGGVKEIWRVSATVRLRFGIAFAPFDIVQRMAARCPP